MIHLGLTLSGLALRLRMKEVKNNGNAFYSQCCRGAMMMAEDGCLYAFLLHHYATRREQLHYPICCHIKWLYRSSLLHGKHQTMLKNFHMLGS